MELKARVKAAREHAQLTQEQVVERIKQLPGVESFSQQALNKLELGTTRKSAFLPHIAHVCGVQTEWLAMGMGEMLNDTTPMDMVAEPASAYGSSQTAMFLSEDEVDLILKYQAANGAGKNSIQASANGALRLNEKANHAYKESKRVSFHERKGAVAVNEPKEQRIRKKTG